MITSIEQLKDLIRFMRAEGVQEFNVSGVHVTFDPTAPIKPVGIPGETPSEKLDNIKAELAALKAENDADELWSV